MGTLLRYQGWPLSELFINRDVNGPMKGQFICNHRRCIACLKPSISFLGLFLVGYRRQGAIMQVRPYQDLGYFPRLSAAINLTYLTLVISTGHINPY